MATEIFKPTEAKEDASQEAPVVAEARAIMVQVRAERAVRIVSELER